MNEKIKAALGFSESEAFDHICYQYRATPMVPTAEVVTNFTAVKDAVTAAIAEAYRLGQEQMRERCAKEVDAMVDWPLERHPAATITDSYVYLLGIRRGLVNATNSIRALPVEE